MATSDKGQDQSDGQHWSEVHVVRLSDLSVGYSPRQTKVDQDHVAMLAEVLDRLPPIVVDDRTMTVIDGVHRLEASRPRGWAGPRSGRCCSRGMKRMRWSSPSKPTSGTESPLAAANGKRRLRPAAPVPRSVRPLGGGDLRACALHRGPVAPALGGCRPRPTDRSGRAAPSSSPRERATPPWRTSWPASRLPSVRQAAGAAGVGPFYRVPGGGRAPGAAESRPRLARRATFGRGRPAPR